MNKLFSLAVLSLCITGILLVNCSSNKSSDEACRFQTTMDLDRGNYDAVLASPCVSNMQIGAAWFGKAGFDMKEVINRFSETGSSGTSGSDLNSFMTSLVGKVDAGTFTAYDNAKDAYILVSNSTPSTSNEHKDALFYESLVDAVKGLSLIKIAIQDPAGLLDTACDLNGNSISDQVDATTCALKVSFVSGETCTAAPLLSSYITVPTFTIYKLVNGLTSTIPYPNTFTAMNITTGPTATAACGQYTKLLYNDPLSLITGLSVATTSEDKCEGSQSNPFDADGLWPCPIDNVVYLNFVAALDASLNASITTMSDSLFSGATGTTTDVQQSINDIKYDNCCVDEGQSAWDPTNPASCACSSSELAAYLQTI